jgi:hypothetical protein
MDIKKEFRDFSVKHLGNNGLLPISIWECMAQRIYSVHHGRKKIKRCSDGRFLPSDDGQNYLPGNRN